MLSIREREFVDAAILMGASRRRIYFKEILPNLWAPLLVYFTLLMPAYVSAEAALSLPRRRDQAADPDARQRARAVRSTTRTADFFFFFIPALIIAIDRHLFNLLGDGIRDALDPKIQPLGRQRLHKLSAGQEVAETRRDAHLRRRKLMVNQSEAAGRSSRIHGRRRRPGRLWW